MLQSALEQVLLPDERLWMQRVLEDPRSVAERRVYADWLDEQNESTRAQFLRRLAEAMESLELGSLPIAEGIHPAWRELLSYDILQVILTSESPADHLHVLDLQRPALRYEFVAPTGEVPVGATKSGGLPDLPSPADWPQGQQCKAIYNDSTNGYEQLAGFLGQVNLQEIAETPAARDLPKTGLLSFFCFQDWEDDNPDAVGVAAFHFPDLAVLKRTDPPQPLTDGNREGAEVLLAFEETLDLPESYGGPWSNQLQGIELNELQIKNFNNMMGYGRATTGDDPTPDRDSRHLILLSNEYDCRMHIQIPQAALERGAFDELTLSWVDFD